MGDWSDYYALKKLEDEKSGEIMRLEDEVFDCEEQLKTGYWSRYHTNETKLTEEDRQTLLKRIDHTLQEIGRKEEEAMSLYRKKKEIEKEIKKD